MEVLILAAGKGTRMRSEKAKVLHPLLGRPILGHVLDTLRSIQVKAPGVVLGANADQVRAFLKEENYPGGTRVVVQAEQKGTGHAVMMAAKTYAKSRGEILIWPGDMPLLQAETIRTFLKQHREAGACASVLSAEVVHPEGYGRILRRGGRFYAIREELDASRSERQIQEVNTGVYLFDIQKLLGALKKLKPANAKQEYYLTDTLEILAGQDEKIEAFPLASADEAQGINSRAQLAEAVKTVRDREANRHMNAGVTLVSPEQTFIEPGVTIGADTVIYPWTYIERGVKIGRDCQIGPCAKLRAGSVLKDEVTVGSFVEINRSILGSQVTAKHLAYLGDAELGEGTNVGAGTITANFDGRQKHFTRVGKKVLLGSNTVLVAPLQLPDGVRTGAGCVVLSKTKLKKNDTVAGVPARVLGNQNNRKR